MKRKPARLAQRYQAVLRQHLEQGGLESARGLGSQALAAGLQTLDLAKLHERTLVADVLPGCPPGQRAALIKQAGIFFAVAITPIEKTPRSAREATAQFRKFIETLSQRTVELAAANRELNLEITHRQAVEEALKKSERHYSQLLTKSDQLQGQLRRLSRQIISAQEDERKKISRELHNVIAQSLTGINLRLAALKKEAAVNTRGLDRNIARTQRLVEQSVSIVHQFARELRPAALDDLGLIPALHSFMKNFTSQTGVQTRLTASKRVEELDTARRTVLYRVAQEALTNVSRHARASHAQVNIQKVNGAMCLSIVDNGRGFQVERLSHAQKIKRLGLLGMRERVEMINGRFTIESAPGQGTTIQAQIPLPNHRGATKMTTANLTI
ncbi:MAG: sensor histidine kinase [Verrucomicrobia bacterium]|nr:sensor histidine kinase [Verrucomicrobiota bacterium]